MYDSEDLEYNLMKEENIKNISSQFPLKKLNLPNFQGKIVSMSSSKKYIYFITDIGELFRLKSGDLSSLNQAHKIRPESSKSYPPFKEKLTKIWTDIAGNHSIIRYKNSVYYFNSEGGIVKELTLFKEKQIEIFAVGFDETNQNVFKTGNILISDYNNNIYEYSITITNMDRDDFSFKDKISLLDSLIYQDWDKEEDDDTSKECDSNSRIYGIKFYRTNLKPNVPNNQSNKNNQNKKEPTIVLNNCYIILVTKNKMFQLRGQCENDSFKLLFEKYKKNHSLYNESCKYFPENKSKNDLIDFDINIILNKYNKFEKFGWRTQCGYIYGEFEYGFDFTPEDINKSIFVPFTKITQDGKKVNDEPLNIVHSINHIFVLNKDSLSIISKINTNIIHTQYLAKTYNDILYNKFSENNGNLILISKDTGVYYIPLDKEDINIWQDYLEIGNYDEAVHICEKINPGLIKKIKRTSAEEYFDKGRGYKAAKDFSVSDEKFETVCILFLMKNDYKNLKKYLTDYTSNNLDNQKNITQFMLVTFLLFNIHLKENKNVIKTDVEDSSLNKENIDLIEQNKELLKNFNSFIKENKDFLNSEMIYQILQSNGRMEEYIEYATIMQDYDKVILYYINEKNVPKALHELSQFAHSTNKEETLKKLCNIFQQNAPLLFKQSPKESIALLKEKFQKFVDMEIIIRAIVSMTDKDEFSIGMGGTYEKIKIKSDLNEKEENEKKEIKKKNENEILSYLRNLIIRKDKHMKEERNVHNLYIYYLSKSEENQDELLEYLKTPLNIKENMNLNNHNKGALFQLDYAKKLFRNNPEALSLVLALMGKYSEGVNLALKTNTKKSKEIAKFIATNTQNEQLKKKLWIDIFCDNKQNEKDPIKIMKESKILKIEDVLPYISDEIKIEDFKTQISKSINEYEENINHLKEDINNYNKANEVIIDEIYKINKKSTELKYSECKCDICHKIIKNKNLYLFPCGHIFDAICIKKCLKNYEKDGVTKNSLIEKNKKIAELFKKLKINEEPEKNKEESNEKKDVLGSSMGNLFSKIINIGKEVVNKTKELNSEKLSTKEIEEEQKKLNELLSEQCVFCGEYLIENVQNSLIDEEKDAIEWAYA